MTPKKKQQNTMDISNMNTASVAGYQIFKLWYKKNQRVIDAQ